MNDANHLYNFEINANFKKKKKSFGEFCSENCEIPSFKVYFDWEYGNLIASDCKNYVLSRTNRKI